MKRFCALVVLMVLSSSAYAGESFSFTVAGHRIHIEALRHCRSTSCVSVSIPGVYETRRSRERYDDRDAAAAPAKPLGAAPAPALASAAATPASTPAPASAPAIVSRATAAAIQPAAGFAPPSPAKVGPTASTTPPVAAPPPSNIAPSDAALAAPAVTAPAEQPPVASRPFPEAAKVLKISREAEDEPAATPLGEWRTEGKTGSVRIERCGRALCGYILDASSHAAGETVLINMKSKASAEWSGNIYSRDSGNTYYATMAMQGPNALRVEACALGRFFCSGNVWSRINTPPDQMISSSQASSAPRS
jgi:uncharacterized protein (DUF2147 family)